MASGRLGTLVLGSGVLGESQALGGMLRIDSAPPTMLMRSSLEDDVPIITRTVDEATIVLSRTVSTENTPLLTRVLNIVDI